MCYSLENNKPSNLKKLYTYLYLISDKDKIKINKVEMVIKWLD